MDAAGSLDRAWDASAPGAGALRATAVTQLYFRMTGHHPLTILVVDALCLVFGADGATVQELVDHLGITEDRVRYGLESVPAAMRCTARQLEAEVSLPAAGPPGDLDDGDEEGVAIGRRAGAGATRAPATKETRYFLNYKRLLPLVYAHVTRLLLSTCETDVPPCPYVESVRRAQLAAYQRADASTAHAFFATRPSGAEEASPLTSSLSSTGDHIDVSDAMKRKNAIRGVACVGCSCYFLTEEFQETLTRCPRCGKDSLRLTVQLIRRQLHSKAAEQRTLVTLLPPVRQVWKRVVGTATAAPVSSSFSASPRPSTAPAEQPDASAALDCDLSRDPFLFQQALAFLWLYSTRFASVNDAPIVVDVQEILTEPEYRERLRGRASLADQFRSRHRHASAVRVRLVSQRAVDTARRAESHRKLLKRAMLPPWLRHAAPLSELGGSAHAAKETAGAKTEQDRQKRGAVEGHVPTGGAVWDVEDASNHSAVHAPAATQRRPHAAEDGGPETAADLTRMAAFIAAHYHDDAFDEVPLPLSRRRRTET